MYGIEVYANPLLTVFSHQERQRRTLAERLFTFPWRPWRWWKLVAVYKPDEKVYCLQVNENVKRIFCHPVMMEQVMERLRSIVETETGQLDTETGQVAIKFALLPGLRSEEAEFLSKFGFSRN